MEKDNFKSFIKNENRKTRFNNIKKSIGNTAEYIDNNSGTIFTSLYIISIFFTISYLIFGTWVTHTDTTIKSIYMIEKKYVNDTDSTYIMNIVNKNKIEEIKLDKDEYNQYLKKYNSGIKIFKLVETDILYWLVLIYFLFNIILLLIKL